MSNSKNITSCQLVRSKHIKLNSKNIDDIVLVKKKPNSFFVAELHETKYMTTKAIQKICSSEFDSIELPKYNSCGTTALMCFAKSKKALTLGLTKLTPKTASVINLNTAAIDFDKLIKISANVTAILSRFKGNCLGLDGLSTISNKALENLIQYKGEYLSLCGLESINSKQAALLAKYKGSLFLDGIKTLNPSIAGILLKQRDYFISLKGLKTISNELLNIIIASKKEVIFKNLRTTNFQKNILKEIKSVTIY